MRMDLNKLTDRQKKVYSDIGYKVGYLRRVHGITQEQLAEKANLSIETIAHLEANVVYTVSLLTIIKIAEALDVPLYKLFQFDEE